jgi:hypothetical protein
VTAVATSGKAICYVAVAISAGYLTLPFRAIICTWKASWCPLPCFTSAGRPDPASLLIVDFKPGFIVGLADEQTLVVQS